MAVSFFSVDSEALANTRVARPRIRRRCPVCGGHYSPRSNELFRYALYSYFRKVHKQSAT